MKILLCGFCYLDFKVKPEKLGKYTLKIIMKMSDGKEYSDSFRYDFSTGPVRKSMPVQLEGRFCTCDVL